MPRLREPYDDVLSSSLGEFNRDWRIFDSTRRCSIEAGGHDNTRYATHIRLRQSRLLSGRRDNAFGDLPRMIQNRQEQDSSQTICQRVIRRAGCENSHCPRVTSDFPEADFGTASGTWGFVQVARHPVEAPRQIVTQLSMRGQRTEVALLGTMVWPEPVDTR